MWMRQCKCQSNKSFMNTYVDLSITERDTMNGRDPI